MAPEVICASRATPPEHVKNIRSNAPVRVIFFRDRNGTITASLLAFAERESGPPLPPNCFGEAKESMPVKPQKSAMPRVGEGIILLYRLAAEVLFQHDNPPLQGCRNRLRTVPGIEFLQDVAHVKFDRDFGDVQGGGDFLVAVTFGDHLQHLHLTSRQRALREAVRQSRGRGGTPVAAAAP